MKALLSVIVAIGLSACGDGATPLEQVPDSFTATLLGACPGLKVHASDIRLTKPVLVKPDDTVFRERGWRSTYGITVKVSDTPSSRLAHEFKATGQSCAFLLDADGFQTVAVSKSPCMAICRDKAVDSPIPYVAYFGIDGSEQLMR